MKRIFVFFALVLALVALPLSARAAETDPGKEVEKQAKKVYYKALASAKKDSFSGYCGLMTSLQLYYTGINEWAITNDGNKQYDYYAGLEVTSGGYYVTTYAMEDYSMEEALNTISRNGTRDVYNILVGFQWTNTEAGAKYGHAVFINAILDGTVYLMESSYCALGGAEGTVIRCSIPQFVEYYSAWTTYEGMIHFGMYLNSCSDYETDVYLQTRFDSTLRSLPCLPDRNECVRLRDVAAGERLHATAVYENRQGELFYRVEDGYISANAVSVLQTNDQAVELVDFQLPEKVPEGEDLPLSGQVTAQLGQVTAVSMAVSDDTGALILRERAEGFDLAELEEWMEFDLLSAGTYRVEVTAEVACAVVSAGKLQTLYNRVLLLRQNLQVGDREQQLPPVREAADDGWVLRNGSWHYYRYGKACTGWFTYCGIEYYFDDTGAAVTGWQEVDGWRRYFSATGALVTGWFTDQDGVYYLNEDGIPLTGEQTVDGVVYQFGDTGVLQ